MSSGLRQLEPDEPSVLLLLIANVLPNGLHIQLAIMAANVVSGTANG